MGTTRPNFSIMRNDVTVTIFGGERNEDDVTVTIFNLVSNGHYFLNLYDVAMV
jgi:hypothetical protein